MFPDIIKNWLNQFKENLISYKDGFVYLPYKGNAPQQHINTFSKLPFVKFNKEKNNVWTNTPFMEGGFWLQELEDGCWIMCVHTKYKMNVCQNLIKDKNSAHDYYQISLNEIVSKPIVYNEISDKKISFPKYSWTFMKPTEDSHIKYIDLKFAGSLYRHVTFYFNRTWFENNLAKNSLFTDSKLNNFIQSEQRFLFSPFEDAYYVKEQMDLFEKLFAIENDKQPVDVLKLKLYSLTLVFDFLKHCKTANLVAEHHYVADEEQEAYARIEKYLNSHLFDKFPGIGFLAERFKISDAKLQNEFKQMTGKSVFQYFQEKQMFLAKELMQDKTLQIKEVAYKFGYSNSAKFSAAFKKHHGILPSDL